MGSTEMATKGNQYLFLLDHTIYWPDARCDAAPRTRTASAPRVLLRRVTLVLRDGRIEKVFYPVFPPDRDAEQVMAWLEAHPPSTPN